MHGALEKLEAFSDGGQSDTERAMRHTSLSSAELMFWSLDPIFSAGRAAPDVTNISGVNQP